MASSNPKSNTYSKILNNLLDIRRLDPTIFTKVNGISSFDITTKFGESYARDIIFKDNFILKLKEIDFEELIAAVKLAKVKSEVVVAYEKYKERLSKAKQLLLENPNEFITTKQDLIDKLDDKVQRMNTRWKQFRRKALDINIQSNIWPLHVATAFMSTTTTKGQIYAPLILKEVQIKVEGSKIIIQSSSENTWKINKKLIFLLNREDYSIDDEVDNQDKITIADHIEYIAEWFNSPITKEQFVGEFNNFKKQDIKNKKIEFFPGVVLGIFQPAGGHLRKAMLKIIDNKEIEEIIDIEPDKRVYKEKIEHAIINTSNELLRIQPSNYSQDRLLSSALIQDTIIWGPPGTGKSQVIANIIANILYRKQTAIIMSQKKAALDVLKHRLGKLKVFTLFILNDNKMKKAEFYKPLQEFVEIVENAQDRIFKSKQPNIITSNEIEALTIIKNSTDEGKYKPSLQVLEHFGENDNLRALLFQINPSLTYPKYLPIFKEYLKVVAQANNIKTRNFWFFIKYPPSIKSWAIPAWQLLAHKIDVENYKTYVDKTDEATINSLIEVSQKLTRNSKYESNEDYLVSYLSTNIIEKIRRWKVSNRELFNNYKKFARAVRAGRRIPHKFINDHSRLIKALFPIVITTPETLFVDWEKNSIDYVVLDESSQIFLEIGLPILYLGKTKILAGDNQQMQPSRWFTTRDESESDEEDVAENAESALDYAIEQGVYKEMLNQNYRSSTANLMAFSAKHFYESKLEVINNAIFDKESIKIVNVEGQWDKGTNLVEAKKVVAIAKKNIRKYKKIIILTFNSPQRQLIEKMILEDENDLSAAMEEEKLAIRNIENIQGDEADLVIVSIVYDATTHIGATYVARRGGKNALNVAISRAKDKMIVVKSVTSETIRPAYTEDFKIFKQWLRFLDMKKKAQQSYSINHKIKTSHGEPESSFEADVIQAIKDNVVTKNKLRLISQYPVGSKRIDIALVNDKKQYILGIEVDGYKYHNGYDKYLADWSRQVFLENKGYQIFRIKEIDWKLDKMKVLANISSLLNWEAI